MFPFSSDVDLPSGSKPQRNDSDDEDDNDDVMDMSDKPTSSSGTKRQHHQEENPVDYAASSTPPSKRPKPMCKYGAKCYLENADHRSKFAHPALTKEKEEEKALVSGQIGNVRI